MATGFHKTVRKGENKGKTDEYGKVITKATKEFDLIVDDSKGKTNLSGLKLSYAPKTGLGGKSQNLRRSARALRCSMSPGWLAKEMSAATPEPRRGTM